VVYCKLKLFESSKNPKVMANKQTHKLTQATKNPGEGIVSEHFPLE
jgi:hypothetical protein